VKYAMQILGDMEIIFTQDFARGSARQNFNINIYWVKIILVGIRILLGKKFVVIAVINSFPIKIHLTFKGRSFVQNYVLI
jgi:hypothetical protein